jgi:PhnB protein
MLIPHLHFGGTCAQAIALYEKAFNTKAEDYDYRDNQIAHAEMNIHGQRVWLNDAFGNKDKSLDCCAVHLVLTFNTEKELLACYEHLKESDNTPIPFRETSYSKLVGNFMDKFGVLWGFMVVS